MILLDIMLPDINGLELCKQLQAEPQLRHIPIILLTARDSEIDKVLGLELGADDYITKPFSNKELCARVKAVLRRSSQQTSPSLAGGAGPDEPVISYKDILQLRPQSHEALLNGQELQLTFTEFQLLQKFMEQPKRVFRREDLLSFLWQDSKYVSDRSIDVHIKHLRDKLGPSASILQSVRGVGYRLK